MCLFSQVHDWGAPYTVVNGWNDASCSAQAPFVCAIPTGPATGIPTTTASPTDVDNSGGDNDNGSADGSGDDNTGAIVGGVIGTIVVLAIVVVVVLVIKSKQRQVKVSEFGVWVVI